jgi:hypothetical protein
MVGKTSPIKALQPAKPLPPELTISADGEQKPAKTRLPTAEEVRSLIAEMHAGPTSDDVETAREAERLCRALSLRAIERLGLVITGLQQATVPQVVMASIAVSKGARVVAGDDAGITVEAAE